MKQRTYSINSKVRKELKLRDSLSLVNDQPVPVGIAKRRPMANFRLSRSEEQGNIVVAQVSDSAFEVVYFNVTDMPSGETGQSGFLSIANVPAPTSYSMQ